MKRCLEIGVAIYWDVQNVRCSHKNFKFLEQFLNRQGCILIKKIYSQWGRENPRFAEAIKEKLGFLIIHVPHQKKNAVDNEIMGDCPNDLMLLDNKIKIVILITGDKDYLCLVKKLKKSGIKVILIHGNNASQQLKDAADETYNINELLSSRHLNQTVAEENLNYITITPYEEAKNCLIESIKTVQERGKKATLGLMGKLMKEHLRLSKYKKVFPIAKPNGGHFSKLSQFVEAVVQEGLIKNTQGNLILVKT